MTQIGSPGFLDDQRGKFLLSSYLFIFSLQRLVDFALRLETHSMPESAASLMSPPIAFAKHLNEIWNFRKTKNF